jgi:hypothetical protein
MKSPTNFDWRINENDTILCLYYTMFGIKQLYFQRESDLSDFIGCSLNSLIKNSMNIRFLLGYTTSVLEHYSKMQEQVVEKYSKLSEYKFRCIVNEIIEEKAYDQKETSKKVITKSLTFSM